MCMRCAIDWLAEREQDAKDQAATVQGPKPSPVDGAAWDWRTYANVTAGSMADLRKRLETCERETERMRSEWTGPC